MRLTNRLLALTPSTGFSATGLGKLQGTLANVGEKSFGTATPPPLPLLIGRYVQIFLGLLGVIFLALTVYGGYLWLMARGNEQEVEKAKDTIKMAIIGLAVVLGAYAISNYVVSSLAEKALTG